MPTIAAAAPISTLLTQARRLYVSGCAAEIDELPAMLKDKAQGGTEVTGIFRRQLNESSYNVEHTGGRLRSFILTRTVNDGVEAGWAEYLPWRYSQVARWMTEAGQFDTAAIMLAPPDENGLCSLGVQADFLPMIAPGIETIIGYINPRMPRTAGHAQISVSRLSAMIDYDAPLLTLADGAIDAVTLKIAEYIGPEVRDGATVQLGVGRIPAAAMSQLSGHRRLKIHSGLIGDGVLDLERAGALDHDAPVVTGTAIGSHALYDALNDQRRFHLSPVSHTHARSRLESIENLTAINTVLQVDLFGQASLQRPGRRLPASPGGLPDFGEAAKRASGGRSIITLRAGVDATGLSGIVPHLPQATVATSNADLVITEFGVARIDGLDFDQRAAALINIAAPEQREGLARAWRQLRLSLL